MDVGNEAVKASLPHNCVKTQRNIILYTTHRHASLGSENWFSPNSTSLWDVHGLRVQCTASVRTEQLSESERSTNNVGRSDACTNIGSSYSEQEALQQGSSGVVVLAARLRIKQTAVCVNRQFCATHGRGQTQNTYNSSKTMT